MVCKPKINFKSQRRLKFLVVMLLCKPSSCIIAMKGRYCSITHFMGNMLLHLIFMFFNNLFPFSISTSHKLWNSRNFLGEWKKNPYKVCKRASNWTTKLNFDKTNIAKLVQWAKQCTPIRNGATFSFICVVTLALAPWNTILPLQPIEMSLALNCLTLEPLNVTMAMNIKWKMFSIVPYIANFSTQAKSGIHFQPWTTNKCKEIQDVLFIVVTSSMLTNIKFVVTSFWMDSNNNTITNCGCNSLVPIH